MSKYLMFVAVIIVVFVMFLTALPKENKAYANGYRDGLVYCRSEVERIFP